MATVFFGFRRLVPVNRVSPRATNYISRISLVTEPITQLLNVFHFKKNLQLVSLRCKPVYKTISFMPLYDDKSGTSTIVLGGDASDY
jgi:hypothetical protein